MAESSRGNAPITPFVFNFADRAEVRTFMENNEPEFVALDVAKALDYSNPRDAIATHVDEDDVAIRDVIDALGRPQKTTVVSEAGVFQLILRSKKAEAKVFQRWVTHDVLPALRKFGFYGFGKPLTVNQTLAAQKLCVTLAEKLMIIKDAGLREVIHGQLAHTLRLLNLPVPALESLGRSVNLPDVPWRWILERFNSGVMQGDFGGVHLLGEVHGVPCLLIRPTQIIDFVMRNQDVKVILDCLPERSARVFHRALKDAGMVVGECERTIGGLRVAHLVGLSCEKLEAFGLLL